MAAPSRAPGITLVIRERAATGVDTGTPVEALRRVAEMVIVGIGEDSAGQLCDGRRERVRRVATGADALLRRAHRVRRGAGPFARRLREVLAARA